MVRVFFLFLCTSMLLACPAMPEGELSAEITVKRQLTQISEKLTQLENSQQRQLAEVTSRNVSLTPKKSYSLPTLHAFLVVDVADDAIGESVKVDLGMVKLELRKIANDTKLTLDERVITGNELTPSHVKQFISKAMIDMNDVVVFYYSGHGMNNATGTISEWPDLFLSGHFLPLNEVIGLLQRKDPRFFLVLADACNNIFTEQPQEFTHNVTRLVATPKYRHLFMRSKGYIVATGAKKGFLAWGNRWEGGYFTQAFLAAMRAGHKDWDNVLLEATKPISIKGQYSFQYPHKLVNIKAVD